MQLLIRTLFLLVLFLPQVYAAENFFNTSSKGFALIHQQADVEITSATGDRSVYSETATGLGVFAEKYYQQKYRVNAAWSYLPYEQYAISEVVVSVDYMIPLHYNFSLFGGLAGGIALHKFDNSSWSDAALSPVFGAQGGVMLYVNENVFIEAGYRFRSTSLETNVESPIGTEFTIDDLSESYISLQLSF